MLASSLVPMLMKPEVRKGAGKLVKYLLIFGTMGVGILAFVFMAKKINPLKLIGNWFKKGLTNPLGLLGGALGVPSFQQVGKDLGKGVAGFQKDVAKGWTGFWTDVGKGLGMKQKKRQVFRSSASGITREMRKLMREKQVIPEELAKRLEVMQSAFRKVGKKKVYKIGAQFQKVYDRKMGLVM